MKAHFDPDRTIDDLLHMALNIALVEAETTAGSILMKDQSQTELHIKARLGLPHKGRQSEPAFKIGGKGIASAVAKTGNALRIGDVSKEPAFLPLRPGPLHFKALLCVPIKHKGDIFGVISADHEKAGHFSERHLNKLKSLGIELGKIIADKISVPEALQRITEHLMHETADGDVEKTLQQVAENIRNALGADLVILYQYDSESEKFIRTGEGTPTVSGELLCPEYMTTDVFDKDVPYHILKSTEAVYVPDVGAQTDDAASLRHQLARLGQPHPDRARFSIREKIKSVVGLPLIDKQSSGTTDHVGVLFVNYRQKHVFNSDEKAALQTFAASAAFAILSARREEQSRMEKTGLYFRINPYARTLLLNRHDEKGKDFLSRFEGGDEDCFVMAIDIRHSTDLMLYAIDGSSFETFIGEVEDQLKEAVRNNCGIVDKFTGDGLIAHFPLFFAGEDAGGYCLKAAAECHKAFTEIYERRRFCFSIVLSDVGLGIGIDYGKVHFTMKGQELIAVGRPVVFACRLSSVEGGHTVLNQQAADLLLKKHAQQLSVIDVTIDLKHLGLCHATDISRGALTLDLMPPFWNDEVKFDKSGSLASNGISQAEP
jgi:GAF domain-containing protein/class 3 adenylate cyclase